MNMKTELLCLGMQTDNPSHAEAIQLVNKLAKRNHINIGKTVDTKNLRELITAMVPAIENNKIIFVLVTEAEYVRAKNTLLRAMGIHIIAHPAVLRNISTKENETIPAEIAEDHAAMPKGCTVFLSEDGFYSGFSFSENNQYVIMLPLESTILAPMIETSVNDYFTKTINKGKMTKVIGLFGIGKTEVETALSDLFPDGDPCSIEIKDFGGELQLVLTVSLSDDVEAAQLCEDRVKQITALFQKNIYGTNQSRLAELTVNSLKASGFDVAIVINPGAKTLITKLAAVPEYSAFFKFVEASVEKGSMPPNDYAARLANTARINSGADFGAAITNMFSSNKGEKLCIMYIALADGKHVWVRKVYSKSPDNVGEILNSAAACLLELIYRKSESTLKMLLTAPPVVAQPSTPVETVSVSEPTAVSESAAQPTEKKKEEPPVEKKKKKKEKEKGKEKAVIVEAESAPEPIAVEKPAATEPEPAAVPPTTFYPTPSPSPAASLPYNNSPVETGYQQPVYPSGHLQEPPPEFYPEAYYAGSPQPGTYLQQDYYQQNYLPPEFDVPMNYEAPFTDNYPPVYSQPAMAPNVTEPLPAEALENSQPYPNPVASQPVREQPRRSQSRRRRQVPTPGEGLYGYRGPLPGVQPREKAPMNQPKQDVPYPEQPAMAQNVPQPYPPASPANPTYSYPQQPPAPEKSKKKRRR